MIPKTQPTIDDADEIIADLRKFTHLMPDGSNAPTKVETNRADDNAPNLLRVSVPRKSTSIPKLIDYATDQGLDVEDLWQHDADMEDDRVFFKLKPRDPTMEDALEVLDEMRDAFAEYGMTTNEEMLREARYLVDNYYEELVEDDGYDT